MLRFLRHIPALYSVLAFLFAKRVLVQGWSMHPALVPGEYVLFDRLAYRLASPHRGDIVLASHPADPKALIIKRVDAVSGDRVRTDDSGCWINGVSYGEKGSPEGIDMQEGEWLLGEGEHFLLGDADSYSTDSRHFGPLGREAIHGRAWLVYWPLSRFRFFPSGNINGP